MARRSVAIVGVGQTPTRPAYSELSYRELVFEAACKAYEDAQIDPRRDVDSFVAVSEDFNEGTSIFDEYVPDQLGGALRPVCTVCADGIYGLIVGFMQIQSGIADVVVVEAHSKASDVADKLGVFEMALDPIYIRPLGLDQWVLPALEMTRYLHASKTRRDHCARVVEKNKKNALLNPIACYGAPVSVDQVLDSEPLCFPITRLDSSGYADGATVLVLEEAKKARRRKDDLVWITGVGWSSDSPAETRNWNEAEYAALATQMAYKQAGIKRPIKQLDFAELDDTFSYKELQHIEAAGICNRGGAKKLLLDGVLDRKGSFPVNASGGSLGVGYTFEMNGLHKAAEATLQLRGQAGKLQLDAVKRGLVQAWRGPPTTSGAACVLAN